MDTRIKEILGIKNRYVRWLVVVLVCAAIGCLDANFLESICSGILLPIAGIFLGPASVVGFAIGGGLVYWLYQKSLSFILVFIAILLMTLVPWLLRRFLGDKNKPIIVLKYYVVILASVLPAVIFAIIYCAITTEQEDMYYYLSICQGVLCTGYALGFPLYYLIRCLLEKDFRNGKMGVHVFCIWMPLQFGVCVLFALKAYSVSKVSDIYENWLIVFMLLTLFFVVVAVFVWLFCKRKRIMMFIFALILLVSSVYNIVSFDTGFGTYILIVIAVWISFHAVCFKFYEKSISASAVFKAIVSAAQIVLMYIFVLVVALNAATYAIPRANGNEAGMILLGAPVKDDQASDILLDRIDTAAEFLNEHTEMMVIATGGTKVQGRKTEAQVITEELEKLGVSGTRIIQETSAKTTKENFKNCGDLIVENGGSMDDEYIIATSMFHMLRAGIYARSVGFTNIRYLGASSIAAKSLTWYIREAFSILPLIFS